LAVRARALFLWTFSPETWSEAGITRAPMPTVSDSAGVSLLADCERPGPVPPNATNSGAWGIEIKHATDTAENNPEPGLPNLVALRRSATRIRGKPCRVLCILP